jgi:hypothetical protein
MVAWAALAQSPDDDEARDLLARCTPPPTPANTVETR